MRGFKSLAVGGILVLLVVAALGYWQRSHLLAWWDMHCLATASEEARGAHIDRLVSLGESGYAALLDGAVSRQDCLSLNSLHGLDTAVRKSRPDSPITADLAQRLARRFDQLSPTSQTQAALAMATWFDGGDPSQELVAAVGRVLTEIAGHGAPESQAAGCQLASVLVRYLEGQAPAREMAKVGLRSTLPAVRLEAVRLSLQPGIDLLDHVVALLQDPSVEVRRAAILAVGPAEQVVRDDLLLPGLHDPDPEVRRHTEAALRGRGLKPEHLELGRLLTAAAPTTRLRVLDRIDEILGQARAGSDVEIDPGVWLRRLSHDGSPAVRAAALRLMSQQRLVDLTDRIEQMARSDPSPSVAQMARFYLPQKR